MEVRNFTSLLLGIEDIDIDLTSFATFQKKNYFLPGYYVAHGHNK
jgi:hypothetical protein